VDTIYYLNLHAIVNITFYSFLEIYAKSFNVRNLCRRHMTKVAFLTEKHLTKN